MKKILIFSIILILAACNSSIQYPFQNPDLTAEERAQDLISRLTLEEKVSLMKDQSDAIPRLGIKKFNWWSEALHGVANNNDVTVFPQPIGMAASFNDEMIFKIFDAASDELRAKYHHAIGNGGEDRRFLSLSVWTPNVNIFRDPRWGRGQETYGEDPYLTSRLGNAVIKGLQGPDDARYRKLLACAKHFAVHSGPEWSRHSLNLNNVDPRDLYETYLPAFKSLVQEGNVRQVMCAYQRLDDEPCCGNTQLLQRILRDDWGFKYVVVSDCDAISDFYRGHGVSSSREEAAAKGVIAGTDVECAWQDYNYKSLIEAVEKELITEDEINKHLNRIIAGRIELGEFDDDKLVPWTKTSYDVVNSDKHKQLALEMARETMTLLQNNNNTLPLSKTDGKIALLGPNADDEILMWGNYNGIPNQTTTILEGIATKIEAEKLVYDPACDLVDEHFIESYIDKCSFDGQPGVKASYWNNNKLEGDIIATDQINTTLNLTAIRNNVFFEGVAQMDFAGKYETTFKPTETEELVFKVEVCGWLGIYINGEKITEFHSWKPILYRAAYQFEENKEYKIEVVFKQTDNWPAILSLDFGKKIPIDYNAIINKLKGIDIVVFAGGISPKLEGEEMPMRIEGFKGGDRTNIELPTVQRNLLKALKQAGKKIIFINCSGSALALSPETKSCDAILQAWYGGEEGGQAVADVLFGDYNPSGKLPITFYRNSDQLPDFEDYSMKNRTYRYMEDALFPFGYGLSYTIFSVGEAKTSKTFISANEITELNIPVTNSGKMDGAEVVQVYIRKANDTDGPLKTLKGYKRIEIETGKTAEAIIPLPYKSFEFYDRDKGEMTVLPGEYDIYYGNSSDKNDLKMVKVKVL